MFWLSKDEQLQVSRSANDRFTQRVDRPSDPQIAPGSAELTRPQSTRSSQATNDRFTQRVDRPSNSQITPGSAELA